MVAKALIAADELEKRGIFVEVIEGIPLGRMAKAEEIAQAILFLSADESNYITGEIVDVNGGSLMD